MEECDRGSVGHCLVVTERPRKGRHGKRGKEAGRAGRNQANKAFP